ncbi:unnamed protein product [Phytophthora lilii]|uniref:Unnamed protein product n=1 Tax=Phytophthora lilii TaxID=2077276 RepID=A0A9W6THZ3_9STRA|nr:unnamed protein product [Phytophthora lilii]
MTKAWRGLSISASLKKLFPNSAAAKLAQESAAEKTTNIKRQIDKLLKDQIASLQDLQKWKSKGYSIAKIEDMHSAQGNFWKEYANTVQAYRKYLSLDA